MSQDELGELIGIDGTVVSGYERGASLPRIERLERMAKHLGVEVKDFFDVQKPADKFPPEVMRIALLVRRTSEKLKYFPRLAFDVLKIIADTLTTR
jgi:transcriptional regulator with XRE-family HTH domain